MIGLLKNKSAFVILLGIMVVLFLMNQWIKGQLDEGAPVAAVPAPVAVTVEQASWESFPPGSLVVDKVAEEPMAAKPAPSKKTEETPPPSPLFSADPVLLIQ